MESVPRNVILDLLPTYIAGEASEETKILIEEFAKNDPEIEKYISTGKLESDSILAELTIPERLELKTIKQIRNSIQRKMWYVAFVTTFILMIPLVSMQFTDEVNWDLMDFVVMGVLLFSTGLIYVLVSKTSENLVYRIAVGISVVSGLLLIWINLAVGIIGSENNPANLLYIGVLLTGIIGAWAAQLKPQGMARTMFLMALIQLIIPFLAILIWKSSLEANPGLVGVFILSAFFATLFTISGLLFRRAAVGKSIF